MSSMAKLYIFTVLLAGAALAVCCALAPWQGDSRRLAAFILVTLLASALKVKLPGLESTVSAGFVIFLVAAAQFSLAEGCLLAGISALIQCYWKSRARPSLVQVAFNVSALALSVAAAFWLSPLVVSRTLIPAFAVVAATIYFVSNTLIVSAVVGLVSGTPVLDVWQRCHAGVFPYYLVGAAVASVMTLTGAKVGWVPEIAVFPAMILAYVWYRAYLAPQDSAGARDLRVAA